MTPRPYLTRATAHALEESLEFGIRKMVSDHLARELNAAAGDACAFDHEIGFILARLAMRYGGPDLLAQRAIVEIAANVASGGMFGTVKAVCASAGRHHEYDPYCEVCDWRPPSERLSIPSNPPAPPPTLADGSANGIAWVVDVHGHGDPTLHENIRNIVRAEIAVDGGAKRARIEADSFAARFGYQVATFDVAAGYRRVSVRIART